MCLKGEAGISPPLAAFFKRPQCGSNRRWGKYKLNRLARERHDLAALERWWLGGVVMAHRWRWQGPQPQKLLLAKGHCAHNASREGLKRSF
jgi:hypothetical protein